MAGSTYLAKTLPHNSLSCPSDSLVVIKQFQFAKGKGWDGYKAIDRETQVLKDLRHPSIPRYLGGFETKDSFCLIQEYKDAQPLSTRRSFTPDEVKHLATALLEVLVYSNRHIN